MIELTADLLATIAPGCNNPDAWVAPLNDAMARFDIGTAQRAAAFLAQIAEESGQFNRLEENLDYRAERLVAVWPARFPTLEAARPYEHAPEKLANRVYALRLGNGDAAGGDGWRFRGRGLIQITGRDNYRNAAAALGRPYEEQPDLLAAPADAALSAAQFWKARGLNELADSDRDFSAITQRINGSLTGDAQRRQFWAQAKGAFDVA
jgi:putative chitinase